MNLYELSKHNYRIFEVIEQIEAMYNGVPDALVLVNKNDEGTRTIFFDADNLNDYEAKRAEDLILCYMNQKYNANYNIECMINYIKPQYYVHRKGKLQFKYYPAIKGKQTERLTRTRIFDEKHIVTSDIDISKLSISIDYYAETYYSKVL